MKTIVLTLVTFLLLVSCTEDNPQPVDRFAGSWHFYSPETPIEISFNAVNIGNGAYNIENRKVVHPAIPVDHQGNNQITLYDKFENGNGYGRIEITSRGPFYYKIILIYNRFTDESQMLVYDLQIDIPSEPFVVLNDQVFTRSN